MALRDRAPESDFRGQFSGTETKLDEGNTAISGICAESIQECEWLKAPHSKYGNAHIVLYQLVPRIIDLLALRMFESCRPGLRVFANSDSEMQRFESSRLSQPVRVSATNVCRGVKTAQDRGISRI
jgi:hypothetical protein